MRAAKIYLILMGLMSVVFGVGYLIKPELFADPMGFGFAAMEPSARTDVRATYGGFQIGMGLFMFWCARFDSRVYTGMLLTLLSVACIAASRALGMLVLDGSPNDTLKGTLGLEVTLTIITIVLLARMPKPSLSAA